MRRLVRRPSPALVVALIALFVALGGSAYAAAKLNGGNLLNRSVSNIKIRKGSLTRTELNLSRLGTLPRATLATSANFARNAGRLDGHESGFYQEKCQPGSIRGFAVVNGTDEFPSGYTSDRSRIPASYNCAGGAVEARRVDTGSYRVRFVNVASEIATANSYGPGTFDEYISLNKEAVDNSFEVVIRDDNGEKTDHHFVIMVG